MMKILTRIFQKNKIRKKLIMYFMLTTFLMAVTSLFTYYNVRMLMNKMDTMFVSNVQLNELYNNVNKVKQNMENFLATKHSDSLREYNRCKSTLRYNTDHLSKDVQYNENGLMLKDIRNMIDAFIVETDAAIQSKRGRDINEYISHYNEASKLFSYIDLYINKLNKQQFQENTDRYMAVGGRLNFLQVLNISIILGVVVFNVVLILWFTFKITEPIITLSKAANEISRGNFEVEQVVVDTHDEVSIMSDAFNRMTASIKQYIDEIKEKAELEGRLKEQEMQNLIMKNVLKEAELQALQSQINPHFIFNTLNAGAQIAMLEGADKTCIFVENVANLFRYNLRKLEKPVTLREEINNTNTYIFILKARFADRIGFSQQVDDSILDVRMPCMVLQPIVENAFIHGIGEKEDGGHIWLRVEKGNGCVRVQVEDNGRGMEQKKIDQIVNCSTDAPELRNHTKSGHTTGIGLNNVISRLRIFYSREDVLEIDSSPGKGTVFTIKIPIKE